jgi:hypothetical protein
MPGMPTNPSLGRPTLAGAFFSAGVTIGGVGGLGAALADCAVIGVIAGLAIGNSVGVLAGTFLTAWRSEKHWWSGTERLRGADTVGGYACGDPGAAAVHGQTRALGFWDAGGGCRRGGDVGSREQAVRATSPRNPACPSRRRSTICPTTLRSGGVRDSR